MKKLYIVALLAPLLFSCSKKEGCNDRTALNYDEMVVVDDGTCNYSNLTFYANSSELDGITITSIDISVDGAIVGSFVGSLPIGAVVCNAANTAVYSTHGETSVDWTATINLQGGGVAFSTGSVDTQINQACIVIHALP